MAKRTIRKRMRKSKTIRKVMRGCNGRRRHNRTKVGGTGEVGKVEVPQYLGRTKPQTESPTKYLPNQMVGMHSGLLLEQC